MAQEAMQPKRLKVKVKFMESNEVVGFRLNSINLYADLTHRITARRRSNSFSLSYTDEVGDLMDISTEEDIWDALKQENPVIQCVHTHAAHRHDRDEVAMLREQVKELQATVRQLDRKGLSSLGSKDLNTVRHIVSARFDEPLTETVYFRWPCKTESDGIYEDIKEAFRLHVPNLRVATELFSLPEQQQSLCRKLLSHYSVSGKTDMMVGSDLLIEVKNPRRIYKIVRAAQKDGVIVEIPETDALGCKTRTRHRFLLAKANKELKSYNWFKDPDYTYAFHHIADTHEPGSHNVHVSSSSSVAQSVGELVVYQFHNPRSRPVVILTSFDRVEASYVFFFATQKKIYQYMKENLQSLSTELAASRAKITIPPYFEAMSEDDDDLPLDVAKAKDRRDRIERTQREIEEAIQDIDVDSTDSERTVPDGIDDEIDLKMDDVSAIASLRDELEEDLMARVVGCALTYEQMFHILACFNSGRPTGFFLLDFRTQATEVSIAAQT